MHFESGGLYHIYNRGNNKQPIFFREENYVYFIHAVRKLLLPACDILGWCLMPNHFHFVVAANDYGCREVLSFGGKGMQVLSKNIGKLLSGYSQAINKERGTTGSLFQQKTKAKPVLESFAEIIGNNPDPHYLISAIRYIHQNPVRAGLVRHEAEWRYSSYLDYAGLRHGTLCNQELLLELTMGRGFMD
jgi:putative transposase